MKNPLLGLGAGVLSLALVAGCGGSSVPDDGTGPDGGPDVEAPSGNDPANGEAEDTVAIVNQEEISRAQLDGQMDQAAAFFEQQGQPLPQGEALAQLEGEVLGQLVQQRLLVQEAESRGTGATEEEVQTQYDETVGGFPDEETFEQALAADGLSPEALETLIAENLKITKLLDAVVTEAGVAEPSEEDLRDFYGQVSQQQELPPFDEIEEQLRVELIGQRESEVIQNFIEELEAESDIQVLL